jgi:serine phosphatase RsbU (regulator of sigma subunit)
MKKVKNYFDLIIGWMIYWILLSNIWVIMFLQKMEIDLNNLNLPFVCIIFLFEALVITYLISINYSKPLNELNEHINNFITWKSKNKEININTNYKNPNIRRVMKFFDVILNSLKNIKDEFLSWKSIKSEVQLATELQEKLLNKKLEIIPSIDVIARSTPAWEIWWDSYDIIRQEDNYYIYVWDATGHGVWAWFVMVMVNALISWFSKVFKSSAQILANTNEILKPRVKSNILMTILMVRWNEAEKRLFMSGAGHEYLIVYKHALKKCFLVKSGGLALWMTKNVHKVLKEQEIKFEKNDLAVLYTDWITESINQNKKDWNEQMFWEKRLIDAIEKAPELSENKIKTARSVFNNITIEISKFMWYKPVQLDDITLVVMHYKWEDKIENDFQEQVSDEFITEWNWI